MVLESHQFKREKLVVNPRATAVHQDVGVVGIMQVPGVAMMVRDEPRILLVATVSGSFQPETRRLRLANAAPCGPRWALKTSRLPDRYRFVAMSAN
jgi:hypothetical protein